MWSAVIASITKQISRMTFKTNQILYSISIYLTWQCSTSYNNIQQKQLHDMLTCWQRFSVLWGPSHHRCGVPQFHKLPLGIPTLAKLLSPPVQTREDKYGICDPFVLTLSVQTCSLNLLLIFVHHKTIFLSSLNNFVCFFLWYSDLIHYTNRQEQTKCLSAVHLISFLTSWM